MIVQQGNRNEGLSFMTDNPIYSLNEIDCIVNRKNIHSNGSIYLTDSKLIFISSVSEDYSIVIDFIAIGVHAICHSTDIYCKPCIYCQVSDPNEECDSSYYVSPNFEDSSMEIDDNTDDNAECVQPQNDYIEEILLAPNNPSQRFYLLLSSYLVNLLFEEITKMQSKTSETMNEEDSFSESEDIAFDCDINAFFQQPNINTN